MFTAIGPFPERFINLTARAGINFFNIRKIGGVFFASVMISEYRTLRIIARKSSMKIKIQEKHGLPFIINRYKKRLGLFVGVVAFAAIIYFLSLFVWSVDVSGNSSIEEAEVRGILSESGVGVGTLKRKVDTNMLEKTAMARLDNLSWVSVNLNGSSLSFELKERVVPPELLPKDKPCNVKSTMDGQVIRMEVYKGKAEVANGDAITKGQLLVNGVVEDTFGGNMVTHAKAKVFAATRHVLKEEIDMIYAEDVPTDRIVNRRCLTVFGFDVPVTLNPVPKGRYKREIYIEDMRVNGVKIPITMYTEKWIKHQRCEVKLSRQDAIQKANERLKRREEIELGHVKILSQDKTEKLFENKYVMIVNYSCEEDVAVQEEIMFD